MKIILVMIIMMGTIESRAALVGGGTFSTIKIDDTELSDELDQYLEYAPGLRLGLENVLDGAITGLTYSQRGYQLSLEDGDDSGNIKLAVNYLTGYALARIRMSQTVNILAGAELGYFMGAEMQMEFNGEEESESIDRDDFDDMGGNALDYGLVVGARFQLAGQLHAVGTYYIGLEDLAEESVFKHRSFQVYLAYSL